MQPNFDSCLAGWVLTNMFIFFYVLKLLGFFRVTAADEAAVWIPAIMVAVPTLLPWMMTLLTSSAATPGIKVATTRSVPLMK